MKTSLYAGLALSALLLLSCGKDEELPIVVPPSPQPPEITYTDGLNILPESPDADGELTIAFKAAAGSALYGYAGDVYLHTGVVDEGSWLYVPAAWSENLEKCKLTRVRENVWSITLSPSVRTWFASGQTPVQKLGIVLRSADGTKKAIESDSFVTLTDSKYTAFQPAAIRRATMPAGMREGINVTGGNEVTLVLYDKDTAGNHKDFAHVLGDFNNWKLSNEPNCQMLRDDAAGCWWITLTGLDATKEYAFQYYVGMRGGETIRLGDAYAEKILDPDNDKHIAATTYPAAREYPKGARGIASVFRIQREAYAWQVKDFRVKDADKLVVYELLLRDFSTTGDLNGAMEKLDYLQALGVNAIELMPVQEFDGNNSWGYNPCYYFALDKAYGTPQMYKRFIDACHSHGMAVILDVVYNHATGNHPFVRLYWDAAKNKTLPNNPWFNVDAPHPYSVFHDFNHESPLVRAYVKRNLEFLLTEYKIDGFRFDLTKGLTQKQSNESTAGQYDASRIAILAEYNDAIRAVKADAVVILEHFCDLAEEKELAAKGMRLWRNMNYHYGRAAAGVRSGSQFTSQRNSQMPAGGWVAYMESHDEERVAYEQRTTTQSTIQGKELDVRMKQLGTNAAFFFTLPGPKMVWQFGELGYDYSIKYRYDGTMGSERNTDPKPVKWDYYDVAARKQLYTVYSKLLKLRNDHPELFATDTFRSWQVGEADWDAGRTLRLESTTKKLVVAGNFTDTAISVITDFGSTGTWHELRGETLQVTSATQNVSVPAHEFRLYVNFEQ